MKNKNSINFSLTENQTVSIGAGSKVKVECSTGKLWITGSEGKDIVIGANQKMMFKAAHPLVIQGVEPSKISVSWL